MFVYGFIILLKGCGLSFKFCSIVVGLFAGVVVGE